MAVDDALVGGRYRLLEAIGRGGMGAVWRARDEVLQRQVAIKQVEVPAGLPPDDRALMRARVMREARAAARMNHPGSVTVFDVLEEDGTIDIVMELVDAPSLADVVRQDGPLTPGEAATVGLDLLAALEAAHAQGIVHRDVKPGNILVLPGGTVRLTDFGVASLVDHPSLTTSGKIIGSPAYMAPEQALGHPAGPPADLWGLGATLYYTVEGRPPFQRDGSIATLATVVNEPLPPPVHGGPLTAILVALLTKEPALRPTTPQLRSRLTGLLAGPGDVLDRLAGGAPPTVVAPADTTTRVAAVPAPSRPGTDPGGSAQRGLAAGAAAAARVRARGPSALQQVAGDTGDADAVVVGPEPPSRWSPRWGLLALAALATLALLALVATWAVGRDPGDGTGADAAGNGTRVGSGEPGPTTSAGVGISAGTATPPRAANPSGGATGTTAAAPPTSTAAGPTPSTARASSVGAAAVPPGWRPYADPSGAFTIAHPPGWTVRPVDDTRVDFVDPDTGSYMRVDWVQPPGDSAVGAWRAYAPRFAAENPGYQEIRIEPTTFRGLEAAEWEFRYGEGGRLHAVDLGMISGRYGFALNFQTPESQWQAMQPIRRGFEGSFQPAS